MNRKLVVYGFSLWLTTCLLTGLSSWNGQAYAQFREVDKTLETVKKKKERKRWWWFKPKSRPDRHRPVKEAPEPLMENRSGSSKSPLPPRDQHFQPELNGKKTHRVRRREPSKITRIYQGEQRVKKNRVTEPGTHHAERKARDFQQQRKDSPGHTYAGNRKVKKSTVQEPGQGQEKSGRAIRRKQREEGTGFAGFLRRKKSDINKPGTYHTERKPSYARQFDRSNEASSHSGNKTVKKRSLHKPGTHYTERKESEGKRYSSYIGGKYAGSQKVRKSDINKPGTHYQDRRVNRNSTVATNHPGNKRVKKKYLKEPGTYHADRSAAMARRHTSASGTSFEGHLKAISKNKRSRFYEKQAKKVHQYEGSMKLKFAKGRNMHPSHVARNAKKLRSQEQVARYRGFSKWWNRLWKKEQPAVVNEKPHKPRYDGNENEIWDKSRDW